MRQISYGSLYEGLAQDIVNLESCNAASASPAEKMIKTITSPHIVIGIAIREAFKKSYANRIDSTFGRIVNSARATIPGIERLTAIRNIIRT